MFLRFLWWVGSRQRTINFRFQARTIPNQRWNWNSLFSWKPISENILCRRHIWITRNGVVMGKLTCLPIISVFIWLPWKSAVSNRKSQPCPYRLMLAFPSLPMWEASWKKKKNHGREKWESVRTSMGCICLSLGCVFQSYMDKVGICCHKPSMMVLKLCTSWGSCLKNMYWASKIWRCIAY